MIQNVHGRKIQSLDGTWRFIPDPYECGYYNYRRQPNEGGYFKNAKMQKSTDLVEYNFEKSWPMRVPGDWNTQRKEMWLFEGTAWYGKKFKTLKKKGKRYFIHFGAVNYLSRFWINGEKLGEHVGGFTPIQFEVTDQLKDGENFVAVMVDNFRREEAVPTVATDWWNYGGITRKVVLIEEPEVFVRDYSVGLSASGDIEGWVQLDGVTDSKGLAGQVQVDLPGLGVSEHLTAGKAGRVSFKVKVDLKRWSPENPKLYDMTVSAGKSVVKDRVGFRTIEVHGRNILLNGKQVFLRGISIHEEISGKAGGRANTKGHAKKLLGWAKELGCNFVRLAHYPHNEFMVKEAERMGLMVWEEIPVYWTIQWQNKATLKNARNQLKAMIERDRNRAAVVMWSVGNETPLSDERLKFMITLVKDARKLDSARLLTAALEQHALEDGSRMIDDPLGAHLDVLGLNEYLGWYDRVPGEFENTEWNTVYDKPLVISEFGAGAKAGKRGKKLDRWTEDYQAAVYEEQIAMLNKVPMLRGMTPWILKDFLSPRRPLPEIQDFFNRKGLVSETGRKKMAFKVLKEYYGRKANLLY